MRVGERLADWLFEKLAPCPAGCQGEWLADWRLGPLARARFPALAAMPKIELVGALAAGDLLIVTQVLPLAQDLPVAQDLQVARDLQVAQVLLRSRDLSDPDLFLLLRRVLLLPVVELL